ncbi:MAG: hypothetical protein OXG53_13725 [Chloroflexi bacterium]|nr:hypothetical protein [Chloroflexota bacterium]
MTIEIPEDVALRLEELSKQDDADIGDLLRDLLARYEDERAAKAKRRATGADFARNAKAAGLASPHPVDTDEKQWATLADLARHAKKMNMASPEPVNTAERSREILNTEYADYLYERRVKGSSAVPHK